MTKDILTQKHLKSRLSYNESTGYFTWLLNTGKALNGDVCGRVSASGYLTTTMCGKRYSLHRLVWLYVYGEMPPEDIDHINGDRADNRLINLRSVSRQDNHKNRMISPLNKTGIMGVSWDKSRNKWVCGIAIDKKRVTLGRYIDFFEACCARKSAEIKYNYHPNHGKR